MSAASCSPHSHPGIFMIAYNISHSPLANSKPIHIVDSHMTPTNGRKCALKVVQKPLPNDAGWGFRHSATLTAAYGGEKARGMSTQA